MAAAAVDSTPDAVGTERCPLPLLLGALLLALVVVALAFFLRRPKRNGPAASASDADQSVEETTVAKLTSEEILADAAKKAAQYDYDAAIAAIEADEKTAQSEAGQAAITKYNEIKGTLVRQDPQKITHVFSIRSSWTTRRPLTATIAKTATTTS